MKKPGYMEGGLKQKYEVKKRDGSPIDPNAIYFVLRIDTDPHARVALKAYASSIFKDNPQFAKDIATELLAKVYKIDFKKEG